MDASHASPKCFYYGEWLASNSKMQYEYLLKINEESETMGIGMITNDSIKDDTFLELDITYGSFCSYLANGYKQTNTPRGLVALRQIWYCRYNQSHHKF